MEKKLTTVGDASGVREQYWIDTEMEMGIEWYPEGKEGNLLKVTGEPVTITRGNNGLLVDYETFIELRWLLSAHGASQKPGHYEIVLSTGKDTARDELVKVARGIK